MKLDIRRTLSVGLTFFMLLLVYKRLSYVPEAPMLEDHGHHYSQSVDTLDSIDFKTEGGEGDIVRMEDEERRVGEEEEEGGEDYRVAEREEGGGEGDPHERQTELSAQTEDKEQNKRPDQEVYVMGPGENYQVDDLEVHLTTASHYRRDVDRGTFSVFFNGWMRHGADHKFKCCFLYADEDDDNEGGADVTGFLRIGARDKIIQVSASLYHEFTAWIVSMQNAEFSCIIQESLIDAKNLDTSKLRYVSFAKDTCSKTPLKALPIVRPPPLPGAVGICMKVSYGSVNPEKAIEWMEYARMMNVTRVFTLTHDLDPPIKRVFEYYSKIGFLEMIPVNPAIKKGGKPRHFRPPRDSQQAWVDATMAAQDCKHRLAGFDYLFILDVDEFIVPQDAKQRSYLKILQASSKTHPEASGLIFDSHVVMLNWNTTRKSPLYITTHVNRTLVTNYDGNATNTRWAFRPKMVYFVQNNRIWPNRGTKIAYVDHSLYHLLHYRKCKMALWKGCLWAERTEEKNMLLVETPMIKRLRQLPLEEILPENMGYVEGLRNWKIPGA